jgi:hypothetical protein
VWAFAGVFAFLGAFILYVDTLRPAVQSFLAQRWMETPCVVDSSEVAISPGRRSSTYHIKVVYHYDCDGQTYTAHRYQFGAASSTRARARRIVSLYPPGKHAICYVNPNAPGSAVIERGLNLEMVFGAIGIPFLLVGLAAFYFAPVISSKQRMTQPNAVPQHMASTGESMALKPDSTPLGKFVFMLCFALFWNGFISIFFYLTFLTHDSSIGWFPKIFVGFFVFIGVLLLGSVLGSFIALFNPRIRVTARTRAVPLGGEFHFEWNAGRHAARLKNFRIRLEGREQAVSRRGKSTQILNEIFADIPILETADRDLFAQGQGRVVIPAGLMHSLHGRNNKILWRLRFRGELPYLAPLEEDFPIDVLPHAPTN